MLPSFGAALPIRSGYSAMFSMKCSATMLLASAPTHPQAHCSNMTDANRYRQMGASGYLGMTWQTPEKMCGHPHPDQQAGVGTAFTTGHAGRPIIAVTIKACPGGGEKPCSTRVTAGRSGVIRTLDPHVPNVVRYQTALHSVTSGASIDQHSAFDKRRHEKSHASSSDTAGAGQRADDALQKSGGCGI